jgi:hypothetical protein
LDNDNIVITSSVYNDNWALANRSVATPAWEGTRIRVFKKAAVYIGSSSVTPACTGFGTLCPGASQATPTQIQGDFYDLWGDSTTPYTVDRVVTRVLPDGSQQQMFGLHYEPEHVRGRSLATYNGNGNLLNQWSAIWGAVDQASGTANPQTLLYHRAITYSATVAGSIGANLSSTTPVVNTPAIMGGIPTLGILRSHTVPGFTNPQSVFQRAKLTQPSPNAQLPTPFLYVGDDRPHRVILREGHHYIARVGTMADLVRFDSGAVNSTVIYDIVQKLAPAGAATEIYNTSWGNGRYYAPMFDTPANVVQYGSVSPVQVLPFLEKLFVGTTFPPLSPTDPRLFNFGNIAQQALAACKGLDPGVGSTASAAAYPGLFDMRCGEDAYDTAQAYRHPITGGFTPADFQLQAQPSGFPNQIVPFGIRGGAATDPNNMGLWLYGAYAKGRLASIPGFGQWGTYVAHYPLSFPIRDVYNNLIAGYTDVPPGHPFFTFIQIAKQTEIEPGSRTATTFNVNGLAIRGEMARWVIRAQMDEPAITAYLNATGGIYCSFADVQCPGTSGTVTDTTGGASAGNWRYIETMYRRGYTKGCQDSNDGQRRFCPTRNITRGEMAVFIIRAKMNSVFPTVVSGAFTTSSCVPPGTLVTQVGDQFGLFVGCSPYFSDVANTHVFYAFIQKLRELRITNGTSLSTASALGTYSPEANITRGELMTFVVRGFFP